MSFPRGVVHPNAKRERNDRIRVEIARGRAYQDVATEFGISRQRVEQIIKPEQAAARSAASDAVAAGRIARPECCAFCGSREDVEMHHPDYSQPLQVVGLCQPCHRTLHGRHQRRRAKGKRVSVACVVCGSKTELRPCEAKRRGHRPCSPECVSTLRGKVVEARIAKVAVELRRYAKRAGYVPPIIEFAMHAAGGDRSQAMAMLVGKINGLQQYGSYAAVADRIYQVAGFARPDGRTLRFARHRASVAA